jgi:excisionase family DNA binding protein
LNYVTVAEAARRIRVSKRFLQDEIAAGQIEASKLGPHRNSPVRVSEAAIDAYMRRRLVPAGAAS